jgi:hypothetical protein
MDNPLIDKYGTKHWRDTDGKSHRDDGPAEEWASGIKRWYQHGDLHRDDGPAVEWANGDKRWWLNNQHLSFDKWLDEVDMPDENKVMMKLQYG